MTRIIRRVSWTLAAALAILSTSAHANVLYFEDHTLGTSVIPGALTAAGLAGVTTTAGSAADFDTLVALGGWDLVIFGEQNTSVFPGLPNLATYISGGGSILATTWLSGSGLSTAMGADSRASTNGNSITADGSSLFAGLPGNISLTNPGWGIFSSGWNPAVGSTCLGALSSGGCAAILGNGGSSLLIGPLFDTFTTLSEGELLLANGFGSLVATPVPEPASLALLGAGILAFGLARRRRRQ